MCVCASARPKRGDGDPVADTEALAASASPSLTVALTSGECGLSLRPDAEAEMEPTLTHSLARSHAQSQELGVMFSL